MSDTNDPRERLYRMWDTSIVPGEEKMVYPSRSPQEFLNNMGILILNGWKPLEGY
jgi:hypothetical protein